jgi:hypothetical protein
MKDQKFPHQVNANDVIITYNGKEVVFLVETFLNDVTLIRFKSGKKIICYSHEVLEVIETHKSFKNCVKHNKNFNN